MISVIVPVYNSAPYLEDCLNSICSQTYRDLEILAVDDGSTDESLSILKQLAAQDPRIIVLEKNNGGASSARNFGLVHASGEYVTFVDSDDTVERNTYSRLISLFVQHSADIVHCGYRRVCKDGSFKDVQGTGQLFVHTQAEAMRCLLEGKLFVGSLWNKLFPKYLLEGLYFKEDLVINEDVLFCFEAFSQAKKIVYADFSGYFYYERENSSCNRTKALRKAEDVEKAAQQILSMSQKKEYFPSAQLRYIEAVSNHCRLALMQKDMTSYRRLRKQLLQNPGNAANVSGRQQLNRALLLHVPLLYRPCYMLYDKIRKPNWDV
mgnify:CR=1 FL=1